jgi:glycine oxidase
VTEISTTSPTPLTAAATQIGSGAVGRLPPRVITVVGAGIFGLWQALLLARAGHRVRLVERSAEPFKSGASQWAGAMIAPFCEAEAAPPAVRDYGREGLQLWRAVYPGLISNGSLVVAAARDSGELTRFSRLTLGHETVGAEQVAKLEPDLAGRFPKALYFADEAHLETPLALNFLADAVRQAGAEFCLGTPWSPNQHPLNLSGNLSGNLLGDLVIDCRGLAARDDLPTLRGVRGERLLIRSRDVQLRRPVRLLHPRASFYIVPWSGGVHLVGATVIESEDDRPMTTRGALELLGLTYALHPGFGEAEIIEMSSGVRPAFPDNVPKALVPEHAGVGSTIYVNGAYRHGFLLAPVMAKAVVDWLATGFVRPELMDVVTP